MLNPKIEILDSLRAFAAISVCLFHFVCTVVGFVKSEIILSLFSVGQFGVQLFFVISGFVIPWSMYHAGYKLKNFFSFFLKRLSRLEPPYLFSIALALVILFLREEYLGKSNEHMNLSVKQVLLHFGYLIPFFNEYQWLNEVYWTLAIEFQYYLLIALVYIPLIKFGIVYRLIIYSVFLVVSLFDHQAFLPYWLPVFLLGILTFLYKIKLIRVKEYSVTIISVLMVCIIKYPIPSVIYSSLPVLCILFIPSLKIKGLHFFGKFSYSIYLIHPLVGASLINVLSHYTQNQGSKFFAIIAGLFVTFVGAWLTYIFIEKPSKSLSSSIKYKSKGIGHKRSS